MAFAEYCSYNWYAKFKKNGDHYIVSSLSSSYIDEDNVLEVKVNDSYNVDLSVPRARGGKAGLNSNYRYECSAAYSNKNNRAYCDGDFVVKHYTNKGDDSDTSVGMNIMTLGLASVARALGSGLDYFTTADESNIKLAAISFKINDYPIITQQIESCKLSKIMERKTQKQKYDDALRQQKLDAESDAKYRQDELMYEKKFRKQLLQGLETNCGTIVKLKGNMILVQTGGDSGAVWFKKDYINPPYELNKNIIACKDANKTYKNNYGEWSSVKINAQKSSYDKQGRKILNGPLPAGKYNSVHIISNSYGIIADAKTEITNSYIEAPVCVQANGYSGLYIERTFLNCDLSVEYTSALITGNVFLDNEYTGRFSNRD